MEYKFPDIEFLENIFVRRGKLHTLESAIFKARLQFSSWHTNYLR